MTHVSPLHLPRALASLASCLALCVAAAPLAHAQTEASGTAAASSAPVGALPIIDTTGATNLPAPAYSGETPSLYDGGFGPGVVDSETVPPVYVPAAGMNAAVDTSEEGEETAAKPEPEGFDIPGGMGHAPMRFVPGMDRFDRPPLRWSTSLTQGFDDNVYSTSGQQNSSAMPKKGSLYTQLSEGIDLLLTQSRFGLSLESAFGGQYYWNREGQQLVPNVNLSALFAYRLSPRAQLSGNISAAWSNQPSFDTSNGLVESRSKSYLTTSSKFDLSYRWSPLISSVTSYSIGAVLYQDGASKGANQATHTLGQSLRYHFDPRYTGVVEGRVSQAAFTQNSWNDANTYYALVGGDVILSRRLTASARTGMTQTVYSHGNNNSSFYTEGSVSYLLSRTSSLQFDTHYGVDDNTNANQRGKDSWRANLSYSQAITQRLRGSLSLNYSRRKSTMNRVEVNLADPSNPMDPDSWAFEEVTANGYETTLGGGLSLSYIYSKNLSFNLGFSHYENTPLIKENAYNKNLYFIGASYQY